MPIKKPPPEKSLPNVHPEFDFALKRDTADVDYIPRIEGGYFRAGLHRPTRPSTGLPPYRYSPLPSSSEYVRCLVLQPGQADDDVVISLEPIWFTRGWTIQEAWLTQNAVVLWGENDLEVSWLDLVRTYLWVEGRATNAGLGLRHDLTMAEVHRTMFARARPAEARALGVDDCDCSFLEVLEQARVVAMTDPRDRIYAFLSLAAAGGEDGGDADLIRTIQPNYRDSFHHAYLEFARNYVRSSRDGRLLHHVVHDDETLGDAQLPSWIPRWNIGYYNSRIPIGPTCMTVDLVDLSPVVSQPGDSPSSDTDSSSAREWCLKTRGVLMDTVTSVLSLPAPEALDIVEHIVPLLASTWFDLEEAVEGSPPLAYAPHMVTTAVLRCLTMGRHAGDPETWPDHMLEYCQHVKTLTLDWLRRRDKLAESGDEGKEEDKTVVSEEEEGRQQVRDFTPSQGGEPESNPQDFLELVVAELSRHGISLPVGSGEEAKENDPGPTTPEAEDDQRQAEGSRSGSSSGVDKVHDIVKSSARNRVFVRTARGYYGLAPGPTTAGDVLAVLSGGYVPFALRPVGGGRQDGNAGCFKIIGQTWVESVMLGPVCDEGPGWQDWRAWGAEEEEIILL
ncbi:unnamed protein product [Clonostachys solani]|uniref:Heterokaryon incompatibility domain-containing protein n=1 Tax=Clonostachys solani TaxID=160281 RepID=A0A9N9YXU9_9HYPO|nr:unnamed protein product [Clonostachys solani]